jgi:FemAB-related protein (PEP-CTERM system-associated)
MAPPCDANASLHPPAAVGAIEAGRPAATPAPVTLESLTPQSHADWTRYVHAHPDGSTFAGLDWKSAVEDVFGHRPFYLLARRDETVCGVLPMFLIRSRLGGRMLISVPYAVYGGPLCDDAEVRAAFVRGAERIAVGVGADTIDWRTHSRAACPVGGVTRLDPSNPDADNWADVPGYATFRRSLPDHPDDVADWLPRKARAAARRASEKHELTPVFGADKLSDVWALYSRSMRRLGSINYPLAFFESLCAAPHRHSVLLVTSNGVPVGGLVSFIHNTTAMPYFVGWDERCGIYGLNNFLYFTMMRHVVERGCRTFDFGRTRSNNQGSFRFKQLHGFKPTPLVYRRWTRPGRTPPDLSPSNPRYALARRVWPRLPLAITRPLGGWLARSIPG